MPVFAYSGEAHHTMHGRHRLYLGLTNRQSVLATKSGAEVEVTQLRRDAGGVEPPPQHANRHELRRDLQCASFGVVSRVVENTIRLAAGRPGGRSVVLGWRALRPPRVVFVLGVASLIHSLTSGKMNCEGW